MKNILAIIALLTLTQSEIQAQFFYGEDILRFSQYSEVGTSRAQAMGGSFTALGGDASSAIINPAGLAFYNRNEFSISPYFTNISNTANYIGNDVTINPTSFSIGQAAAIFSRPGSGSRKKRSVFAVSYNTLVNFYNEYEYSGNNNVSSVQDFFAQVANESGVDPSILDSEFNPTTGIAETAEALYYQAFTIEPTGNGYVVFEPSLPVNQLGRVRQSGNLGQLSLSFANNFDDKLYIGGTVGIQTLNYTNIDFIDEEFSDPEFLVGLRNTNELSIQGTGINLNLGGIYRLTNELNIGASVVTPTIMGVRETTFATISIDPFQDQVPTDWPTVQQAPSDYNYRYNGPFRGNLGLAYYLPSKLGVLSTEVGYVGYGRMKFNDKEDVAYTSQQQSLIGQNFVDAVNFKLGGELRFGVARVRVGYNYLGDPYNTDEIDRSIQTLSLGAGFRASRFFGDASFRRSTRSSSYTPYVLPNDTDFASVLIDGSVSTISLTLGAFF